MRTALLANSAGIDMAMVSNSVEDPDPYGSVHFGLPDPVGK